MTRQPTLRGRRALALLVATSSLATFASLSGTVAAATHLGAGAAVAAAAPPLSIEPQTHCQPSDKPETGLQGQVPMVDRASGRAAQGYNCNLVQIGQFQSHKPVAGDDYENACCTLDYYRDKAGHKCAYYGDAFPGRRPSGTPVMDISNPAHPVMTDYLDTFAMTESGEGMRVNARRGLLVADQYNAPGFDVYDISRDCRHPRLLIALGMLTAQGHEGCFQPDGQIFYMGGSTGQQPYQPIDLTNPAQPKEMGGLDMLGGMHGCSISEDGRTGYFCKQAGQSGVWTVDLSDYQLRRPKPHGRVISKLPLTDTTWCQSTYPVSYGGHPYVIRFGEASLCAQQPPAVPGVPPGLSSFPDCNSHVANRCTVTNQTNFDHPHIIDMADPTQPRIVTSIALQVHDPINCPLVVQDRTSTTDQNTFAQALTAIFGYDDHHCSPDRLHDPTILACANFLSGLRVFDIRNPLRPREVAYSNPGTLSATNPTVDLAMSRPVVLRDRGEILFGTAWGGLRIVKFERGVWPFAGSAACPGGRDFYQAQYDKRYEARCRVANRQHERAQATLAREVTAADKRGRLAATGGSVRMGSLGLGLVGLAIALALSLTVLQRQRLRDGAPQ